jgi:hypothetical protein
MTTTLEIIESTAAFLPSRNFSDGDHGEQDGLAVKFN